MERTKEEVAAVETVPLLVTMSYAPNKPSVSDELHHIRVCLKWFALDLSSPAGRAVSCLVFLLLAFLVPATTTLYASHANSPYCGNADYVQQSGPITFNQLVQLPETGLATISFLTLVAFFHRHGLRDLLLVDDDPACVCTAYTVELDRVFRHLAYILLPSFLTEVAHKVVLFAGPPGQALHVRAAATCAALASWTYRTGVFLLACVFFRLTCELQILRFERFYEMMGPGVGSRGGGGGGEESTGWAVFEEHRRIRRLLLVISHRYRNFILGCLVTITISQLGALMLVLASKTPKNFCNSADIVVCSVVQLTGFLTCLHGAARITHRAQKVVSIASRWHMALTVAAAVKPNAINDKRPDPNQMNGRPDESNCNPTSTFDSRQALVKYLQHNGGGITVFGFALDRGLLHTLFVFEMTLVLWILGKVVVVS